MTNKNDIAWKKLFEKYDILDEISNNGYYEISADQIKEFREPRLMTKFDQKSNLPLLFKENELVILPITRGKYIIGPFKAYESVRYIDTRKISFNIPDYIETLDPQQIYSEANAINTVYIGGVIHQILEEEKVYQTISGRMSTGSFDFTINTNNGAFGISINNSQCEIDAGFESPNRLLLLEAKNFRIDDFNIRQIYYPYRLWCNKVKKEIVPAFFTYSNDVFSFFIYKFCDISNYNSLQLVKQIDFVIEEKPITMEDIYSILKKVKIVEEPEVPFPQANNFYRTIDLLSLLMESELTRDDITANYAFEPRQSNYYADAARYLGLVEKKGNRQNSIYDLTPLGRRIMSKRPRDKILGIVELILQHEVFNKVLRKHLKDASPLSIDDIVDIMKDSHLYNVREESTFRRRASTVKRWIEWIFENVD
ncbi:MAG: type II restriction enzyme [Caldicoprobacterales bacterium]|jgi:hypothetical protein